MTKNGRALAGVILAAAAVFGALLHGIFAPGMGVLPVDGIFRLPPWNSLPHGPASNYLLSDQYLTFLPLRHFFYENFRAGRFPLWNPFISCGAPAVGSMQAAPLFPINLLLLPVHPFYAAGLAAFLKLMVAGASMALYMRRLGAGRPASLYAAIAFGLSGYMVVWLGHPHTNSACLLPLLLYLVELALAEPGARPWILFALAYGAMLLGGHPGTLLQVSLGVAVYFAFRLSSRPRAAWGRLSARLALALAAGLALAAPQLLPYLEYYPLSATAEASRQMQRWAYHLSPATLAHFLLPLVSGSPSRRFETLGVALGITGGPFDNFNERTGYVGVLTLYLAALALWARRDRWTRFYAAGVPVCLYAIWGLPPVPAFLQAVPILNGINPTRLLLFVGFALAVLGGFGLDEVQHAAQKERRGPWIGGLWGVAAAALFWLWARFQPLWPEMTPEEKNFLLRQLPLFLGALSAATAATLLAARRAPLARGAAVLWCAFELLRYGAGFNPAAARAQYYPQTPAIAFLRADASLFRILGIGWALAPNTGIIYGLQDIRGQDFATVRRYEELITGGSGQFFFYTTAAALPPALADLGVKYVLAAAGWKPSVEGLEPAYRGEIAVHRVKEARARADILFDYEVMSPEAVLARVRAPGFDSRWTLLLEESPAHPPSAASASGAARVLSYLPDEVLLEAAAPRPGFLLLRDTYYPGWKAFVNGAQTKIYRADYNFRAVAVPAGTSRVRFAYAPASFYAGVALAWVALVVLAAAYAFKR